MLILAPKYRYTNCVPVYMEGTDLYLNTIRAVLERKVLPHRLFSPEDHAVG